MARSRKNTDVALTDEGLIEVAGVEGRHAAGARPPGRVQDEAGVLALARAYDEAKGLDRPQIWTAERDVQMWRALEGGEPMDGEIAR